MIAITKKSVLKLLNILNRSESLRGQMRSKTVSAFVVTDIVQSVETPRSQEMYSYGMVKTANIFKVPQYSEFLPTQPDYHCTLECLNGFDVHSLHILPLPFVVNLLNSWWVDNEA